MSHDKPVKLNAQISEEAAEWLVEFRTGDIDAAGRRQFDAWVRSSPEHLRAFLEVAAIWNEGSGLDPRRDLDIDTLGALKHVTGNVVSIEGVSVERRLRDELPLSPTSAFPAESAPSLLSADASTGHAAHKQNVRVSANATERPKPLFRRRFAVAASILFVGFAAAGSFWFQFFHAPTYTTAVGQQRTVKLSDGSTVELNSRSTLRVRFSKGERDVDLLEGQVLFHVAKDHARPFIVASDGMLVRAVGTQFDVYRKTEGTVVTVLEGRVAVTTASLNTVASPNGSSTPVVADFLELITARDTAFLSAGEQVTLTPAVAPKPVRANVSAATAWTQHQLVLESKPLREVAEEFNRYSARKLIVEDSSSYPLRLSGVFSTDPDFLIRYLRDRPDITVRETISEIHISHHD
jgi:transmembrane sensor